MGKPVYDSAASWVRITHDPDVGTPGVPPIGGTLTWHGTLPAANPLTFSPGATAPKYQFRTTDAPRGGTSIAVASVTQVTQSGTVGLSLIEGSGLVQSNSGGAYQDASSLRLDVNLVWQCPTKFGPPALATVSFPIAGLVGSEAGSFSRFEARLNYYKGDLEATWCAPIYLAGEYTRPGQFTDTLTSISYLNPPLRYVPAGEVIRLAGTIEFRSANHGGPAGVFLPVRGQAVGVRDPRWDLAAVTGPLRFLSEMGKKRRRR